MWGERSVAMVEGEDGRLGVEWTGDSRWLQVSIGLLGQTGAMRALGPTLKLPDQVSQPTAPCAATLGYSDVCLTLVVRVRQAAANANGHGRP